MRGITLLVIACIASIIKPRAALCAENRALRHQLCVFHRSTLSRPSHAAPFRNTCFEIETVSLAIGSEVA
jgi:hypothetical protein